MSKPLCLIQGPVFSRSGYGDWSRDVAKSIIRYNKYDVKIATTKWGANPIKRFVDDLDTSDPLNLMLFDKMIREPLNRQPDLFVQIAIPNEFKPLGKYNIGMTAGIETTAASGEWIEGLNRMNLNIVTSRHAKKVFTDADYQKQYQDGRPPEKLRVEKPLEIAWWGANTNIYKITDKKEDSVEKIMKHIPETFAFLFVGQWTHENPFHDRKDIGNLIKTFLNTFKNRDQKPCLILKTSGVNYSKVDKDATLRKIKLIETSVEGDKPNVYLIHGELNDIEMNALLNHEKVKCHVSFTHGEGYGHPLLLASLSGKPILAPDWSGHLDFLDSNKECLLQGKVEPIHPASVNQWLIKESAWFNVSYSLAEERLKQMYFSMTQKTKDNAIQLAKRNAEMFCYESTDKMLHNILDKHVPQFAVEQKIAIPQLKIPFAPTPPVS